MYPRSGAPPTLIDGLFWYDGSTDSWHVRVDATTRKLALEEVTGLDQLAGIGSLSWANGDVLGQDGGTLADQALATLANNYVDLNALLNVAISGQATRNIMAASSATAWTNQTIDSILNAAADANELSAGAVEDVLGGAAITDVAGDVDGVVDPCDLELVECDAEGGSTVARGHIIWKSGATTAPWQSIHLQNAADDATDGIELQHLDRVLAITYTDGLLFTANGSDFNDETPTSWANAHLEAEMLADVCGADNDCSNDSITAGSLLGIDINGEGVMALAPGTHLAYDDAGNDIDVSVAAMDGLGLDDNGTVLDVDVTELSETLTWGDAGGATFSWLFDTNSAQDPTLALSHNAILGSVFDFTRTGDVNVGITLTVGASYMAFFTDGHTDAEGPAATLRRYPITVSSTPYNAATWEHRGGLFQSSGAATREVDLDAAVPGMWFDACVGVSAQSLTIDPASTTDTITFTDGGAAPAALAAGDAISSSTLGSCVVCRSLAANTWNCYAPTTDWADVN
jgi:hypothetical protein